MSLTNAYYLAFTAVDLWLLYLLVSKGKANARLWRDMPSRPPVSLIVASLGLILMAGAWSLLAWTTVDSWLVSLDPSMPKPFFLASWLIGAMPFGLISVAVSTLHSRISQSRTPDAE